MLLFNFYGSKMTLLRCVSKNWFLIGIVLAIILASLAPSIGATKGILHPEITVKYIGVFIIFLSSGTSLKSEQLTEALCQVNIHAFVQCFTFMAFPLVIQLLVAILNESPMDGMLLNGLTIVSCMPPPVSSAVILTKAVGGNEAAAVFNSALGSFLGILVTPLLVLRTVGSTVHVPLHSIFIQMSFTVVLPLIIGQIIRYKWARKLARRNISFGTISSSVLLLIIYTTFCDTFSQKNISIDAMSLVSVILLVVVLQGGLMVIVFAMSTQPWMRFEPADTIALIFCCTHKSLTLGIPMIKVIFGDADGAITIPLLVYHPVQILLGGLLAPSLRGWLLVTERKRWIYPSRKRIAKFLNV